MRRNNKIYGIFTSVVFLLFFISLACSIEKPDGQKGKLFIIGGGERSEALLERMLQTAHLAEEDYIFVLPMASSIPDTVVQYISDEIRVQGNYKIASHNFTKEEAENRKELVDSVAKAKLIYITGGDQNRFMEVVLNTPLYQAIHQAFDKGATIAGTSAGAAVMSQFMLTGEQQLNPTKNQVDVIWRNNIKTAEGLSLLTEDIIDQHFIKRSRFNRLISLVIDHPEKQAIGIDEGTAIICTGNQAEVVGEGQVVVLSAPKNINLSEERLIGFQDLKFSLLKEGDRFDLFTPE